MPKAKQPSRKSKAAWRKNIDLQSVEDNLEKKRVAERLGEELVHGDTEASSIFVEDRKGDDSLPLARAGKQRKGLKSLEVLQNQIGLAGLTSRARKGVAPVEKAGHPRSQDSGTGGLTPEQRAIRAGMSKKDIEKLRRAAGRDVKGAFGVIVEEDGPSRRGVEALIGPSSYDVWTDSRSTASKGKGKEDVAAERGRGWDEAMQIREIQVR